MRSCVFAGSFDPFTIGHFDVINKCLKMFDKVTIAVGVNDEKTPMFSTEERLEIIKSAYFGENKVEVVSFNGLLTDFMKERGETVYVRGIRNVEDYKYELTMENFNSDFYPELITVFIPTPREIEHVSSSSVRALISMGVEYEKYIPESAIDTVKKILGKKNKR